MKIIHTARTDHCLPGCSGNLDISYMYTVAAEYSRIIASGFNFVPIFVDLNLFSTGESLHGGKFFCSLIHVFHIANIDCKLVVKLT